MATISQEQLLANLQPADVLLVEGNTRISVAINYLTQSTWSHAAIYIGRALPSSSPWELPQVLVEADLKVGVRAIPLAHYAQMHTRICRPIGLNDDDRKHLINYAITRIGQQYDLKNIFDLARYLFPAPPIPTRFRRRLLALGNGDPTRAICSTLIAQAFMSIHYPKNSKGKIVYTSSAKEMNYEQPVAITQSTELSGVLFDENNKQLGNPVRQSFYIYKASGKAVTLAEPPSKGYAGSGGFTLVDGVQNTMGMNKSAQFLGYSGKDLDAVIDLGDVQSITQITLHAFEQAGSWIYRPQFVTIYTSEDGKNFLPLDTIINQENKKNLEYSTTKYARARFVKIIAKNAGIIETGKPGAGSKAWLFVDEVEIK